MGSAALYILLCLIFCVSFKYFFISNQTTFICVERKPLISTDFPLEKLKDLHLKLGILYMEVWEHHNTSKHAATFAFAIFAYELRHSWGAMFLVQFLSSSSWRQKDGSDNWQGGTLHPPIIADYSNEGQNLRNGNAAAMTNSPMPVLSGKKPQTQSAFFGASS